MIQSNLPADRAVIKMKTVKSSRGWSLINTSCHIRAIALGARVISDLPLFRRTPQFRHCSFANARVVHASRLSIRAVTSPRRLEHLIKNKGRIKWKPGLPWISRNYRLLLLAEEAGRTKRVPQCVRSPWCLELPDITVDVGLIFSTLDAPSAIMKVTL